MILLSDVVSTSRKVSTTRSRLAKVAALSELLRRTAQDEVEVSVAFLSGEIRQRRLGIGWAAFRDPPRPGEDASLTLLDVDSILASIEAASGPGSAKARRQRLRDLLSRATRPEQDFLAGLVCGELRQGALAAIMTEAVASAWGVPLDAVRRAAMLAGGLRIVAVEARRDGLAGVRAFGLRVGTPVQPMLAQTAPSLDEALTRTGPAAVEWKLDGVRIQVHRWGDSVEVFTRTLDRITERVPEVVEAARNLSVRSVILDGEVIALGQDRRPRPFQVTSARVATHGAVEALRQEIPLTPFFFDILHLDGRDLIDRKAEDRDQALRRVAPPERRVPRIVVAGPGEGRDFVANALNAGHEGVMVKALGSTYAAGRRGAAWIKVKPRHTLDLVVLAVERGHGRRQGWLSNLHLGALDPESGKFVMLGKTFKGLTDDMLRWQTRKLSELAIDDSGWVITVRPELVVEIAFDGIQTSTRYPGGMALRFARVVRYREDKRPSEADTVAAVRAIHGA